VNAEKGARPFLGNRNLLHAVKALASLGETPSFRKYDTAKASGFLKIMGKRDDEEDLA